MNGRTQADRATMRRRERRAAEKILENSRLRSHLTDEQAKELMDWGLAHISETVARTSKLPDDDAEPVIEETATAVSRVMFHVNDMTHAFSGMEDEEAQWRIGRLLNNLFRLQNVSERMPAQLNNLLVNRIGMSTSATFDWLMLIIRAGQQEAASQN